LSWGSYSERLSGLMTPSKKSKTTKHGQRAANGADGKELRELALLFLRLGATSFGGPVAHIAMMEDEVVTRRQWLDRAHFMDMIGATNLIPGPNSTELAIHIGQRRAGWPGLIVAGVCFILPAVCIVLLLAWLYAAYGALPQAKGLLYGVQPVVIAIIAQALWKFAATAVKGIFTAVVALAAVALVMAGLNEVAVIALAAVAGLGSGLLARLGAGDIDTSPARKARTAEAAAPSTPSADDSAVPPPPRTPPIVLLAAGTSASVAPTLGGLFLAFLKIGSILYGSGYVLLAFLRADLVERLGWLTDRQLLDAIAIGQVTPGPVFTTATFIGYQIFHPIGGPALGIAGALAATLGIFLPSFLFVGFLALILDRLRASVVMRGFLDAVNAASLALMGVVTCQLLRVSIVDPLTTALAVVSLALLLRTRLNSAWLIAGGAVIGLASTLF
jgi:chromate transporter